MKKIYNVKTNINHNIYLHQSNEQHQEEENKCQDEFKGQLSQQNRSISQGQIEQNIMQLQSFQQSNQKNNHQGTFKKSTTDPPSPIVTSFSQIKRSIYLFKQLIPQFFTDELIDIIYYRAKNKKHLNISQENLNSQASLQSSMNSPQIKLFKQELVVAKSFCNRDYGYKEVICQMQQSDKTTYIFKSDYQSILERVINRTFQQLQRITQKCNLKSLYSEDKQRKNIIEILKQCRKNFRPVPCFLIFQFIKKIYNCQDRSIDFDKDKIKRIYDAISNHLQEESKEIYFLKAKNISIEQVKKISRQNQDYIIQQSAIYDQQEEEKELNNEQKKKLQNEEIRKRKKRVQKLYTVWNKQFQRQLLRTLKKTNNFASIRDHFKSIYPQHANLLTSQGLRNQLHKIIRIAIRRLQYYDLTFEGKLPQLQKLDYNRITILMNPREGRPARLKLIQFYELKNIDEKALSQIINIINNYIRTFQSNGGVSKRRLDQLQSQFDSNFDDI